MSLMFLCRKAPYLVSLSCCCCCCSCHAVTLLLPVWLTGSKRTLCVAERLREKKTTPPPPSQSQSQPPPCLCRIMTAPNGFLLDAQRLRETFSSPHTAFCSGSPLISSSGKQASSVSARIYERFRTLQLVSDLFFGGGVEVDR